MSKLTANQEKFTQGVVAGLTLTEAYKQSYDAKNMKQETIYSKSSLLWKQDKIRARYQELISGSSLLGVWTREKAFSERMWLLERTKQTIEDEGEVRQSTGSVMNQTLDAMEDLSFNDPKLKAMREELEIEKLRQEITGDDEDEVNDDGFIEALNGAGADLWEEE